LPSDVATPVAFAYGLLHAFKGKPIVLATEMRGKIVDATTALRRYAIERLKLSFPKLGA
jgi:hypothetical protein